MSIQFRNPAPVEPELVDMSTPEILDAITGFMQDNFNYMLVAIAGASIFVNLFGMASILIMFLVRSGNDMVAKVVTSDRDSLIPTVQ